MCLPQVPLTYEFHSVLATFVESLLCFLSCLHNITYSLHFQKVDIFQCKFDHLPLLLTISSSPYLWGVETRSIEWKIKSVLRGHLSTHSLCFSLVELEDPRTYSSISCISAFPHAVPYAGGIPSSFFHLFNFSIFNISLKYHPFWDPRHNWSFSFPYSYSI